MRLALHAVSSGYGRVGIINGVSLGVRGAEILAVIGRNGVGKTTLIRTIMGLLPVTAGSIAMNGKAIERSSANRRARLGIGYVPQGRGIFGKMTVAANLALGLRIGEADGLDLERAFRFFPVLRERLDQLAGSMSGGEQQQLAIGRVLAGRPDIVLLDEPSEGIQPNIVQEIGRTVRRLRDEEGLTFVVVEQNLDLIRAVADRCVVLDKGSVVATLDPAELDDPEVAREYLAL